MVLVLDLIALSVTLINFLEVKRTSAGEQTPLWIIPVLLIVTVCIPIAIILLCMFALYRECVRIILKIKYGEKFGGLLKGLDAFQTIGEPIQHVINTCLVFQCPKTMSAQEFYEAIEEKLRRPSVLPQFSSILKKEFGYSYMLKASIFDTAFKKMKLINTENHKLSRTELMLLINEHANAQMPKDGSIPWEILVGSQPIEWRDNMHNYYIILSRVHHALCDGAALVKLTGATYADKENTATISSEYLPQKDSSVTMNFFKGLCETLLAIILIPSWYVSNLVLKGKDKNILKGKKLRMQSHYAMNIEDHSCYVQKIKSIKKRIPRVSFSDVLLTAISASFSEFFTKNSALTEKVTVVLPVLVGASELRKIKSMELRNLKVQNEFSSVALDLPICMSNAPDQVDIISRLNLISKRTKALRSSFHYSINRLVTKTISTCLSQPLLVLISKSSSYTAILSLLPGPPKVTCFDGSTIISDFIGWNPNAFDIGSTMLITTYDDRLHILVSIDEALIENYSDVQGIADNVLKYLDQLDEKISELCK
ncbi:hypothetical protein ILUMI_13674 [Ignelater luminosus]|uniref:O-acyltransferase WSD1 C-terminal domain-containing protein n=1 Tax=Ignelater luminosus TaxID=2038154 RepID=A0A8K0CWA4_IGNLU|nr:hypothetical protein ILUMI_13674 [Ignelater luminosus]